MKILLVEDKKDLILSLKAILQNRGHQVLFVENTLEDALARLNNNEFNNIELAIVDGYFPDNNNSKIDKFNGKFLSEKIKEKHPTIKIISYSSKENCTYGDINVIKEGKTANLLRAIRLLESTQTG